MIVGSQSYGIKKPMFENWRTREAGGIVYSNSKGMGTRRIEGVILSSRPKS
jgi:hypothetical protein